MKKLVLSNAVKIDSYEENWFVYFNNREFKINESIAIVLQQFDTPNTIKNVLLKTLENLSKKEFSKVCSQFENFFFEFTKIGILREPNKIDLIIPEPIFEVGQVFEDYTILELISEKRLYVQVYKVRNAKTNQLSIVKFYPHKTNAIETNRRLVENFKMFNQELSILKKIKNHPNICSYYKSGTYNGYLYIEMEFISGDILSAKIKSKRIRIKDKKLFAKQIISAVAHLHKNNIIHGDLHSGNIMINDTNEIKLIDFGYSHDNSNDSENQFLSHGGVTHYIPPERVRLHSYKFTNMESTKKGEVYQTALLIYTIFYGKNPFKDYVNTQTWGEMAQAIITKKFDEIIIKNRKLDAILKKSLQLNPDDRYNSCEEMCKEWNKVYLKTPKLN